MRRAIAVIDGEHYAPVVRHALAELPYEFVAAHLVGGTEKLRGAEDYGVQLVHDLDEAIAVYEPAVVVDLSDEPVLGPPARLALASRVLAHGVAYEGADFRFDPPVFEPFPLPSLAVIGTGKRTGKTAVTGYLARLLAEDRDVVVVAMGRGGPPEPEVAERRPTIDRLLELSRSGAHAASDYLETAAVADVVTVGCRRCGGGLAGKTAVSNVPAGAELAAERSPDLVIFDGSGAAIPPIDVDRRILVAGAHQDPAVAAGYLNAYRILISDLVVLTMAETDARHEELRRAVHRVRDDVPVIATVLRPRPLEPIEGRSVAFFTVAPESAHAVLAESLRAEHGARDVQVCGSLAKREELRRDLERIDAEVYVVELKAAAVDVVVETASERGRDVVLADNEVRPLSGEADLAAAVRSLADAAAGEPALQR